MKMKGVQNGYISHKENFPVGFTIGDLVKCRDSVIIENSLTRNACEEDDSTKEKVRSRNRYRNIITKGQIYVTEERSTKLL